ncbi:Sec-independent protein translocase subunit TatA [Corynebacterium sp.]|uniref:Sec-independent protein translocase subunit TatA n=1 Tax=Corynebacterium sp. TaxID=1720 RepID=UPI0025C02DCD|nr:Sec-independent protein translocase subunit TatA [Corynebacterium sp.]
MMPGPMQLLIVVLVLVLLFGAAKLPTMARSLGRSMRIFKSEMTEMKKDGATPEVESTTPPAPEDEPVTATDLNDLKATPTRND